MPQIQSSPSPKRISELINMINQNTLRLQPEFQRKLVWNDTHKDAFIDTIIKGFPFPEIYLAQISVDVNSFQTIQAVVDGQQRLSTILAYLNGELNVKTVPVYSDLTDQQKADFLAYQVVVRDLGTIDEDTMKEIFRRINKTSYNLTAIEISNALYNGEFISTGKRLVDTLNNYNFPLFSDNQVSRMDDLNYFLLILATIEDDGYFSYNSHTEDYIRDFDNEYPIAETRFNQIVAVLNFIATLDLDKESIWYRKSSFFTLLIELSRKYNTDTNSLELPHDINVRINSFAESVSRDRANPETDYGKYYSAMYTGTNSRKARCDRVEIFNRYVFDE